MFWKIILIFFVVCFFIGLSNKENSASNEETYKTIERDSDVDSDNDSDNDSDFTETLMTPHAEDAPNVG